MIYEEHEKLKRLNGDNEVVGDFLEWLDEEGLTICDRDGTPSRKSIETLIADFFELDRAKLEVEKRQMIASLRGEAA